MSTEPSRFVGQSTRILNENIERTELQTAPSIFTQIFSILGLVRQRRPNSLEEEFVALPLVYALLSGKRTEQYYDVMYAIDQAAEEYGIQNFSPLRILGDFELGIVNACEQQFPQVTYSGCFFHFTQNIYRKVQEKLKVAYADTNDRTIKNFAHMLMALAFVPVEDVPKAFRELKAILPQQMKYVRTYFQNSYVGNPDSPPRYPIPLWNQFDSAWNKKQKTNNNSEGWHNRFQKLVGKHHPDLYAAFREIQKEQADTEIAITELSLGRTVKAAPKKKWKDSQDRLSMIVRDYQNYKHNDMIIDYLEALSFNIIL